MNDTAPDDPAPGHTARTDDAAPADDAMHVLVGCTSDDRGDEALASAALLARTTGAPLTVVHVHPPPWPETEPGSSDTEWVAYLRSRADEALARAAERLAGLGVPGRSVTLRAHARQGVGRGLIEIARQVGAGVIVAGSAPGGRDGRIAIGGTAGRLLHGSPVPVMLVPRGYAAGPPERFTRMTVAYRRDEDAAPVLEGPLPAAAAIAERLGVPMRLLTLVPAPPGPAARFGGAGGALDRRVARADEDLREVAGLFGGGPPVERLTAVGPGIAETLGTVDLPPGEVLACSSSREGPLRKVFLGEGSGRIVRAAPCPVLLLPRGAAAPTVDEDPQVR